MHPNLWPPRQHIRRRQDQPGEPPLFSRWLAIQLLINTVFQLFHHATFLEDADHFWCVVGLEPRHPLFIVSSSLRLEVGLANATRWQLHWWIVALPQISSNLRKKPERRRTIALGNFGIDRCVKSLLAVVVDADFLALQFLFEPIFNNSFCSLHCHCLKLWLFIVEDLLKQVYLLIQTRQLVIELSVHLLIWLLFH